MANDHRNRPLHAGKRSRQEQEQAERPTPPMYKKRLSGPWDLDPMWTPDD